MIIYCYKRCSTCKKAIKFLKDNNASFEEIDYTEHPLSKEQIKKYWHQWGLPLKKFFNTSGILYREFKLKDKISEMSESDQIEILSKNPKLIKRPLLVLKDKVEIGFNEQKWKSITKETLWNLKQTQEKELKNMKQMF